MSKKVILITELQQPFYRGGPKRGKPTMTKSTITAKRKGDPQHYVEGKNINMFQINNKKHHKNLQIT